jgi:hypothetical protein
VSRYTIALGKTVEPVQEPVPVKITKKRLITYAVFFPGHGYFSNGWDFTKTLRGAKEYKTLKGACNIAIQGKALLKLIFSNPVIYSVSNSRIRKIVDVKLFPTQDLPIDTALSKEFIQDLLEDFK